MRHLHGTKSGSQVAKTKPGSARRVARQGIPASQLKQGPRLRLELNLAPQLEGQAPSKASRSPFSQASCFPSSLTPHHLPASHQTKPGDGRRGCRAWWCPQGPDIKTLEMDLMDHCWSMFILCISISSFFPCLFNLFKKYIYKMTHIAVVVALIPFMGISGPKLPNQPKLQLCWNYIPKIYR